MFSSELLKQIWWNEFHEIPNVFSTVDWIPNDRMSEEIPCFRIVKPYSTYKFFGSANCTLLGGLESMPNLTVFGIGQGGDRIKHFRDRGVIGCSI